MKIIKTVGVVGAGTMGSALAQKFAQEGFRVILADREMKFVERGLNGIKSMLNEGIEKKVFSAEQVNEFISNLTSTDNLHELKVCDIIIEAIFEDFNAKSSLFKTLSEIVSYDTILATNTSSFSVTELSASVTNPERFIGLHYFYHAAKNRLVEVIPGTKTSEETTKAAYRFSILSGKDPIYTKDVYGFAINRFFVPWLNESAKLLGEGVATTEVIDAVCVKTFGIGMGPFALMNATGVPIAMHAQRTLQLFGTSYKVASSLEQQVRKNENWTIGDVSKTTINPDTEKQIAERMMGCVFFVCSQILNETICSAIDLNKGSKIGLKWKKGPIELMKQSGEAETKRLIESYCKTYNEKQPAVSSSLWNMDFVTLEKSGDRAIITMNRPEELNALNEEVMKQLDEKFTKAENDVTVKTIFITGSGKAFVAGADIKFFVKNIRNKSLNNIVDFTSYGQHVFEKIDKSEKKVVAVLNGMALGGGVELALCADVIVAVPKATIAFPETGIGIYPGLGGTQRTAKRTGKNLAKYLILTGKMLRAKEANEIGLIDRIISQEEMFGLLSGDVPVPAVEKISLNENWKTIEIFFNTNSVDKFLLKQCNNTVLSEEEADKLCQTINKKAPVALRIADRLIEEQKGNDSELKELVTVFSTSDALLGLSSIGKKVEFTGK